MKGLLFVALALLLAACLPAFRDDAVKTYTASPPFTHGFYTEAVGVFVASSTARISAFEGPNCALRPTRLNGPDTALVCDAPGRYALQTTGTISAGVVRR